MAMAIILNQQRACLHLGYHRPGGTSIMSRGNIIKEDLDFGTLESQKKPLLPSAISYRITFICVSSCQKFKKVSEHISTKCKVAIALLIKFFDKYSDKALVIFSTNKNKNIWKKNCVQGDDDRKKNVCGDICLHAEDNFSSPPSLQKNNGPSLRKSP